MIFSFLVFFCLHFSDILNLISIYLDYSVRNEHFLHYKKKEYLQKNSIKTIIRNMAEWKEEQILALSPDASSTKAGKGLANTKKWPKLGVDQRSIWGECKGSGKNPYKTGIDLRNIAFKCSCPSRKFPCKHGLGLFLLYSYQKKDFTDKAAPEWLQDWLAKRDNQAEKSKEPKKPIDKKSQQKRAEKREQKVKQGLEDVRKRIEDVLRMGLADFQTSCHDFLEATVPRLIDNQIPGIANQLKQIENIPRNQKWYSQTLKILMKVYLLTEGYLKSLEKIPELQDDLKALIGWNIKTDELYGLPVVDDYWFHMGQETEASEEFTIQRNWLYGFTSGKPALILNFYRKNQMVDIRLVAGTIIKGELIYYPSTTPLRAIFKKQEVVEQYNGQCQYLSDLNQLNSQYVDKMARFPWLQSYPFLLQNVRPAIYEKKKLLLDEKGYYLPIRADFEKFWQLFCISGGHPLNIACIRDEDSIFPLGVWQEGRYIVL